ncbi:MAG: hypothetical protein P8126_05265, partial [Gammaproteobacteria bacterium]
MNNHSGKGLVLGALFLLYPLVVYFGLSFLEPRWLALLLIIAAGYQFVGRRLHNTTRIPLIIAVAAATGFTLITGSQYGLLLYPVLVNGVLFIVFVASLLHPPSVIESLARLKEPDLPRAAVDYTRKVTLVWAAFFAINGTIAFATIYL